MTSPPARRRAVVIGGSGFLGRRLTAALADAPGAPPRQPGWPAFDEVHVFDREAYPAGDSPVPVTSQRGDVCSRDELREALRGAHTVFHLASIVDVGLRKNPRIDAVNVEGTRNVVELCAELGVPVLVYTSSEDVLLSRTPVAGGHAQMPYPTEYVHDYVRTKIAGEKLARAADAPGGLRTCAVRPVHIYGPEDPHAIKTSLRAFAKGSVPFLLGDGSARFDIVYVDNVVHAHLLAAQRLADHATRDVVGGAAYIVGENNAPNYFDFIRPYAASRNIRMPSRRLPDRATWALASVMQLVQRVTGREVPFHRFHYYVIARDFWFDDPRTERELGYRPIVAPDEGQRRTIAWLAGETL